MGVFFVNRDPDSLAHAKYIKREKTSKGWKYWYKDDMPKNNGKSAFGVDVTGVAKKAIKSNNPLNKAKENSPFGENWRPKDNGKSAFGVDVKGVAEKAIKSNNPLNKAKENSPFGEKEDVEKNGNFISKGIGRVAIKAVKNRNKTSWGDKISDDAENMVEKGREANEKNRAAKDGIAENRSLKNRAQNSDIGETARKRAKKRADIMKSAENQAKDSHDGIGINAGKKINGVAKPRSLKDRAKNRPAKEYFELGGRQNNTAVPTALPIDPRREQKRRLKKRK